ncbi:MAG: imelysin family protein, partial [Bacteroidota bacterium]
MKNLIQLSLLAAVFVLSLSSCEQPDRKGEVVINFANLVLDNYQAAHQDALSMQSAIKRFTASPSEATLNTAKGAWL